MKKQSTVKSCSFNNQFMQEALAQAELAYKVQEVPVGAVIVHSKTGEIIAKSHNLVEQQRMPTLHAEMVVINYACSQIKSKYLIECDIYVTLEPCSMCAAAISYAKIARLFYGASDIKQGAVENGSRFFTSSSCFHRPEIYGGILESESNKLLIQFFKGLRL